MVKKLIAWLFNFVIQVWPTTPYYHLYDYMMRWWLVPYNEVILRKVPANEIDDGFETTDNTGPLLWYKRPVSRLLQKCGIAARVHDILRSDLDQSPHDHPWSYLTIILRGGYFEETFNAFGDLTSTRWYGPGSILLRKAHHWHKLTIQPGRWCRTLFITGKKRQMWGFNVNGVKVPYWEYLEGKRS